MVGSGDGMKGAFLGPRYGEEDILAALRETKVRSNKLGQEELFEKLCDWMEQGKVIGVYQGRMEFGPRALGSRSIIGDPRNPRMQTQMNVKIKFRESFRPFAPAVLLEDCPKYFDLDCESPYMLLVAPVSAHRRKPELAGSEGLEGIAKLNVLRSEIPAVTHVDYSARVQTVGPENPFFHRLLQRWKQRTGCSVIVNTSFNVRGEPIVCRPSEAVRCFMNTDMDVLVLENHVLLKEEQAAPADREGYLKEFALD